MADRIFNLTRDGELVALPVAAYETEAHLQALLADHLELLPGDEIDPEDPRRWLLVSREMGVPDGEGAGSRWAVDHLLLDQDGIPTLVEVKRSTDTRIRREIVGQMLDYAANASAHWPVEMLREKVESHAAGQGAGVEACLEAFVQNECDIEDYWQKVEANLEAGRLRLVFVADAIPAELCRVIEFLNDQMEQVDVMGVEIRQYAAGGQKTYVSRLVGFTASAREKKRTRRQASRTIPRNEFFEGLEELCPENEVTAASKIVQWADEEGLRLEFRGLRRSVRLLARLTAGAKEYSLFGLQSSGVLHLHMRHLVDRCPGIRQEILPAVRERFKGVPGWEINEGGMGGFPGVRLSALRGDEGLNKLLAGLSWIVDHIRRAAGDTQSIEDNRRTDTEEVSNGDK